MSDWRKTTSYRIWRNKVIARDKCCQVCGTGLKLHAHHLDHATYFPEKRFWVKNGIALCGSGEDDPDNVAGCHKLFHTEYKRSFREKCTAKEFWNFVELVSKIKIITVGKIIKDLMARRRKKK